MDKFEYIMYNYRDEQYRDSERVLHKNVSFEELGKQGWEVVTPTSSDYQCYLLKRKVEDNTSPSADVSIKNIESIGGEDAARALTRAAYTRSLFLSALLIRVLSQCLSALQRLCLWHGLSGFYGLDTSFHRLFASYSLHQQNFSHQIQFYFLHCVHLQH